MYSSTCISIEVIKLHNIHTILRWDCFRKLLILFITTSNFIFWLICFYEGIVRYPNFTPLVFVRCQTKFVSNTSWMTKWLWKKFWLVTCEKEKYWLTYKFLVLFVKDKLRRCFIFSCEGRWYLWLMLLKCLT